MSLSDWCRKLNLNYPKIRNRINSGWSVERALKGSKGRLNKKLTEEQVARIREIKATGLSNRKVAIMFGVSHGNISQIMRGITWRPLNQ